MDRLDARSAEISTLPSIDLSRLQHEDPAVSAAEAQALRSVCIDIGFFYLIGHDVPSATLTQMFDQSRRFFALPLAEKMALDVTQSPVLRGYTPLLGENIDTKGRGDMHEGFDLGGVLFDGSAGEGYNRYPASQPELKVALDAYREAMLRLSRALLQGFALALELPRTYFDDLATEPQAFLRLLHYPSQDGVIDPTQIGIGAHTDYECFTILAQDENPALQVSDGRGGWIWAEAQPGAFVVNIGDQLARWTNDLFRSTLHRAINRTGNQRYSVPFFFGPNPDAMIEALPGCFGPDRPPRYPPVRAGDYSKARFEEAYAGAAARKAP
jgi:isopenicillin N synthase-like dioxygenase